MPNLRGRPPFILTPLSAFTTGINGEPPIVPYPNEFAYDDLGDKSLGYIEYNEDGTSWKFTSSAQDTAEFLATMKNSGLFDNAAAGVVSRELTYFLYNNDTKSILFNSKLVYPNEYKYYAIRKGYDYVTGRDYNGTIVNVVDMIQTETYSGSGVIVSKPAIGTLLPDASVVDGDTYIVEFFDERKRLLARDVFYAEYMHTFTDDTSEGAITGIDIITTRPYPDGGPDAASLYKDEAIEQLGYSIILVYNNGDTKDVTHEESRITISGLNQVNTDNLTGENPFEVTFTYNPDPDTAIAVSKTIYVHVISDATIAIDQILPVYYVPGVELSGTVRRYFALSEDYSFFEITSKLAADQEPTEYALPSSTGDFESITAAFDLGLFGQSRETFQYGIEFISENIPSTGGNVLRTRYSENPSSLVDVYKRINIISTNNNINYTLNIDIPEVDTIRNGIVPNYFRIKTIDGIYLTEHVNVANKSSFNTRNNVTNFVADKNKPVIIEFFEQTGDAGTEDYSVKITKAFVAYFN